MTGCLQERIMRPTAGTATRPSGGPAGTPAVSLRLTAELSWGHQMGTKAEGSFGATCLGLQGASCTQLTLSCTPVQYVGAQRGLMSLDIPGLVRLPHPGKSFSPRPTEAFLISGSAEERDGFTHQLGPWWPVSCTLASHHFLSPQINGFFFRAVPSPPLDNIHKTTSKNMEK